MTNITQKKSPIFKITDDLLQKVVKKTIISAAFLSNIIKKKQIGYLNTPTCRLLYKKF